MTSVSINKIMFITPKANIIKVVIDLRDNVPHFCA